MIEIPPHSARSAAGEERTVFTLDGMRKLHGWTHSSLSLVLDHLATLGGNYTKELSGFGFPTLREQVIHIFNCEGFWIHTLQARPYADREPADCPDIAAARLLEQEVSGHTLAYLSSLTDQELNAKTELRFPDGDVAVRTPALVLHHVLTHAFHHKGQIAAMCRQLGYPMRDTDLNNFE
jgi:uncharacterized damage-inducible protein DinB